MPGTIIDGQGRSQLFSFVGSSITGSFGIGVYNVSGFARLTGLTSAVGSFTFRYRLGISSGNYQVASSFAVNSGGSSFDVLNPGAGWVEFAITAANSQLFSLNVRGEPIR